MAANRIASADVKELSLLMQSLIELKNEEPTDDWGILRATDHAFELTVELLIDTAATLKKDWNMEMPYGCASTDWEGGVCIDWFRPDRSVALKVPAALGGQHYIFHEFPDGHGIDHKVTAGCLAKWLVEVDDGPDWSKRGEVKINTIR